MEKYNCYTDEKLIYLLRKGDCLVADYIMEKYKPLVRKKANAMFLIGGEPEDLIQEGMIGLFKAVRDFQEEKETSFYHFAEICITRQIYSALEASNRKKHMPLNNYISFSIEDSDSGLNLDEVIANKDMDPEQVVIRQELFQDFEEKVKSILSKMEKEVLRLYLEGNNYIQIAQYMNKTPKSIDNAIQRIRQKVKMIEYPYS